MIKNLLKFIYRYIWSILLRNRNIRISPYSYYNRSTKIEGNSVIHKGAKIGNSEIGHCTYIGPNASLINCKIGRFCSIAENVKVISATHPSNTYISTSPCFFSTLKQCGISFIKNSTFKEILDVNGYDAIIGNDVWIGADVKIIGGKRIGDGAIIALGAVVTKDVPPYAIVAGVPAKIIRYRFKDDEIKRLLEIKWWNKPISELKKDANLFSDIKNLNQL